jgi:hypothetical protein
LTLDSHEDGVGEEEDGVDPRELLERERARVRGLEKRYLREKVWGLTCANMMTQAMMRGMRMAALVNISERVTRGTSFMASYSARISSSSSWTSIVPRSQVRAGEKRE